VPNVTDPNMKMLEYHEISFTYQKIKTTYLDGAIVAMDSWEAPV
jgi:type VI protein secretion system component Hcp